MSCISEISFFYYGNKEFIVQCHVANSYSRSLYSVLELQYNSLSGKAVKGLLSLVMAAEFNVYIILLLCMTNTTDTDFAYDEHD